MFEYAAAELLNKYAQTKVICMDAVYVFLGEKYYCSGDADWVDSLQLIKICENVTALKPLRCGLTAPNIALKKLDGTPVQLHSVKAKFVALYLNPELKPPRVCKYFYRSLPRPQYSSTIREAEN